MLFNVNFKIVQSILKLSVFKVIVFRAYGEVTLLYYFDKKSMLYSIFMLLKYKNNEITNLVKMYNFLNYLKINILTEIRSTFWCISICWYANILLEFCINICFVRLIQVQNKSTPVSGHQHYNLPLGHNYKLNRTYLICIYRKVP